jgi:predicted enzyme related to lactoylglutathione lyase
MSDALPAVAEGNGEHPVVLVGLSANRLDESKAFYAGLFGWTMHPVSAELVAIVPPAGPPLSLRSDLPEGFPGVVPFVQVANLESALEGVVAAGGRVERAPWPVPGVGRLARFADPSGTIYGLAESRSPVTPSRVPMPLGENPRPPAGTICSLEMYAADHPAAARFFGERFGWGTTPTMPGYLAFDPGAGIGGVFQTHTPAMSALAYIFVEDVASTLAAVETAGGRRLGDPMALPGLATFGYFQDPSGTHMGLIGR